jgi:hypothetical protein
MIKQSTEPCSLKVQRDVGQQFRSMQIWTELTRKKVLHRRKWRWPSRERQSAGQSGKRIAGGDMVWQIWISLYVQKTCWINKLMNQKGWTYNELIWLSFSPCLHKHMRAIENSQWMVDVCSFYRSTSTVLKAYNSNLIFGYETKTNTPYRRSYWSTKQDQN